MGTKKDEAPIQGGRRAFLGKMGGAALALGAGALIGKGGLATAASAVGELEKKKETGQTKKARKQGKQDRINGQRKGPVAESPGRSQVKKKTRVRGGSPVKESLRSARKDPEGNKDQHQPVRENKADQS